MLGRAVPSNRQGVVTEQERGREKKEAREREREREKDLDDYRLLAGKRFLSIE